MITQLVLDTIAHGHGNLLRAGLPVRFVDWADTTCVHQVVTEWLYVETPEGETITVPADAVGSNLYESEETVIVLAEALDLSYDALVKACRQGRVLARKSGGTWLTTRRAVEYALEHGRIRRHNKC